MRDFLASIAWLSVLSLVVILALLVLVALNIVSDQFVWVGVGAAVVLAILSLKE